MLMQHTNFFKGLIWGLSLSLLMWVGLFVAVDTVVSISKKDFAIDKIDVNQDTTWIVSREYRY